MDEKINFSWATYSNTKELYNKNNQVIYFLSILPVIYLLLRPSMAG